MILVSVYAAIISCRFFIDFFAVLHKLTQFISAQDGRPILSMPSEKAKCAPPRLSEVSPALPRTYFNVRLIDDGPPSSSRGRSPRAFSSHASLLQAIDGVMTSALCPSGSVSSSSTLEI